MGEVHEVERVSDGRHLALKVLTANIDRAALARFAREAQIAAEIDHPNVVPVHDVGVSPSGMLFLVMELVSGSTLAAQKERYGDAAWALPILGQISAALATMHARGVVHRDLKPANVLLDDTGAKVADFGLASLGAPEQGPDPNAPTLAHPSPAAITRTGAILGTPLYMAPELADGIRAAQPSADVWSFGVMVHELVAGALPFAEPPLVAYLGGRSTVAVTPLAAPSLSADLRALLDACLCRAPEGRPTAAALRDAFVAESSRQSREGI
jgi:serine/threonine-protein kinase